MTKQLLILALAGATVISTGCSSITKQDTGTAVGGVLGGVLGSQVGHGRGKTAATIVGVLAGAFIGGSIGRSMDETDRHQASHALENTPTGNTYSWNNPDTGRHYEVTPTRTWEDSSGPCREYTTEAVIDGKRETLHGTACRKDGKWVASS